MKTTYTDLFNSLSQAFILIAKMQSDGTLNLPKHVAYRIGKNYAKLTSQFNAQKHFEKNTKDDFIEKDKNGAYKTEKIGEELHYIYKAGKTPDELNAIINARLEAEVEWDVDKISEKDIEQIENFPVSAIAVFEQFGMLTELSLETAKIKVAR